MSRFGERFRDGQYSSVSFLFAVLLLTVPPPFPWQPFVTVGDTCPPVPHGVVAIGYTHLCAYRSLKRNNLLRHILRNV